MNKSLYRYQDYWLGRRVKYGREYGSYGTYVYHIKPRCILNLAPLAHVLGNTTSLALDIRLVNNKCICAVNRYGRLSFLIVGHDTPKEKVYWLLNISVTNTTRDTIVFTARERGENVSRKYVIYRYRTFY